MLRAALGHGAAETQFDRALDLNGDGVVNILDVARWRLGDANTSVDKARVTSQDVQQVFEQIVVDPPTTMPLGGTSVSVLLRIHNNTTPVLGYSLDVHVFAEADSRGSVTADVAATNFFDPPPPPPPGRDIITAGGKVRDPFFSVIQDNGGGGVFINAITDDNSTVLAQDNVNDVLAEVAFNVSLDARGTFRVELGAASALSDGSANPLAFTFAAGIITVIDSVPTLSQWGLLAMSLLLLAVGSVIMVQRRRTGRRCVQEDA